MKLYAFQNATSLNTPVGVKDDTHQLLISIGTQECSIRYDVMKEGDCALVVFNNTTGELYPLYNYQHLSSVLNIPTRDFAKTFNVNCITQIDIVRGEPFVKVFMSVGQFRLDDIDCQIALPMSKLNALDAQFGYTIKCEAKDYGSCYIVCECEFHRGARTLPVFLNYGPYSDELQEGLNVFKYYKCEHEYVTIGSRFARGTSRKFIVQKQTGGFFESLRNFRKRLQLAMSILLPTTNYGTTNSEKD